MSCRSAVAPAVAAVALLSLTLLAVAGCGVPDFEAHPTGSPSPTTSATQPEPWVTPTALEPSASGDQRLGVRVHRPGSHTVVAVAYRDGTPRPPAGSVEVMRGDHIRIVVYADKEGKITVSDHSAATTDVPRPGRYVCEFVADSTHVARVQFEPDGAILLAIRVT